MNLNWNEGWTKTIEKIWEMSQTNDLLPLVKWTNIRVVSQQELWSTFICHLLRLRGSSVKTVWYTSCSHSLIKYKSKHFWAFYSCCSVPSKSGNLSKFQHILLESQWRIYNICGFKSWALRFSTNKTLKYFMNYNIIKHNYF